MPTKLPVIIYVNYDATYELLIMYSPFNNIPEKMGIQMEQCIICLQISRKLMIQLAGTSCAIFSLSLISM